MDSFAPEVTVESFHFHKSHTLFHVHRFSAWFWCCRLASVFEIGVYSYKAKSPSYSFITEKVVWS